MREISKELKEAKKELFKVSSKSVIAHAKVVGITALSCMIPITYCVCTNAAFAKVANDMTTEDNYVEEVITDNKGNEEVIYITKEKRGDNFIRVYDESTETENGYDTSYVEYSGDQVTVNTLNILDSYSVPADMLLVDGQEKQDIISTPVEDDYIADYYRDQVHPFDLG